MQNKTKKFDAVQLMRDIRDKIDAETAGMTCAQLKQFIQEKTGKPNTTPASKKVSSPA